MSFRFYLALIISLVLTSCTAITRQIQQSGNSYGTNYPAAHSIIPDLDKKPPVTDLSHYKSVHDRPRHLQNVAIAVAASGGAYRAANFTIGVLMGLENMRIANAHTNLLEQVDYFSSVSGGGIGVGYYLTQLHNHYENYHFNSKAPAFSLNKNIASILARDASVVNPLRQDLTGYLFFGERRGLDLERKLNATVLATTNGGLTLGDIYVPKGSARPVRLPYWALNATIFQNAAVLPFSPDVLAKYRVTEFYHNNENFKLSGNYTDPTYAYDVPVAVGLTASASVPFAIPMTTLVSEGCQEQCYLQLMDGGLADNLGIYTALAFLLQDKSKIKVLIIIDATKTTAEPYSKFMVPPEKVPMFWRILTISTDANRERIKPSIHVVTRDLLCSDGAENVLVVYLDLTQHIVAQNISTQLSMTAADQKLLLKIGQELVMRNPILKKLVAELSARQVKAGQCKIN
jgi:hypothetical protein